VTYDQFLAKYNNKFWDKDGYYGAQCMDLVQFYAQEIKMPRFYGNAKDVANQYQWPHVPTQTRGDVVVFAPNVSNGYFGHIAIYDRPGFYFSQNYPTGSNSHIQYINERIIAILRPHNQIGESLPYSDRQYNELSRLADHLNTWSVAGIWWRFMGKEPTGEQYKFWKPKTPEETVRGVWGSEERKNVINDLFLKILERPAKAEDYKLRYQQPLVDMSSDLLKSEEYNNLSDGSQKKIDKIEQIIHQ